MWVRWAGGFVRIGGCVGQGEWDVWEGLWGRVVVLGWVCEICGRICGDGWVIVGRVGQVDLLELVGGLGEVSGTCGRDCGGG